MYSKNQYMFSFSDEIEIHIYKTVLQHLVALPVVTLYG